MPTLIHENREAVAAVQIRFPLAKLIRVKFNPAHADLVADFPGFPLSLKIGAGGVDIHQPPPFDQMANPGLIRERLM